MFAPIPEAIARQRRVPQRIGGFFDRLIELVPSSDRFFDRFEIPNMDGLVALSNSCPPGNPTLIPMNSRQIWRLCSFSTHCIRFILQEKSAPAHPMEGYPFARTRRDGGIKKSKQYLIHVLHDTKQYKNVL